MSNDDPKSQSVNPFATGGGAPRQTQQASQSFNPFAQSQQGGAAPGASLGSSLNPFGAQPNQAQQSVNPFAASGSAAAKPSESLNPFAPQQTGSASPLASQGLENPLIQPAVVPAPNLSASIPVAPAPQTPSASLSGSLNPFEQSAPVSDSMNPFDQSAPAAPQAAQSIVASRLADQSFNVFDDSTQASASSADPFANIPSAAAPPQETSAGSGYSYEEAEQIRNLAPLEFAPAEVEVQDLSELPDIAAGYIKKDRVKMIGIGIGAVALLFGLLVGVMMKERRTHNMRVQVWQDIEDNLSESFTTVNKLDKLIKEQITEVGKKRRVPWEMNKKLPERIALVNPDLLAPLVPIEPTAMRELSALALEVNLLFQAVQQHRAETQRLIADFKGKGQSKAFSSYEMYAVDVSGFLSRCSKRGRLTCKQHQAKPTARVLAINKLSARKSEVVVRYDGTSVKVDTNGLIPLQRRDVLGLVNPTAKYVDKLGELSKRLERIQEMRQAFQITLDQKLKMETVIAL